MSASAIVLTIGANRVHCPSGTADADLEGQLAAPIGAQQLLPARQGDDDRSVAARHVDRFALVRADPHPVVRARFLDQEIERRDVGRDHRAAVVRPDARGPTDRHRRRKIDRAARPDHEHADEPGDRQEADGHDPIDGAVCFIVTASPVRTAGRCAQTRRKRNSCRQSRGCSAAKAADGFP